MKLSLKDREVIMKKKITMEKRLIMTVVKMEMIIYKHLNKMTIYKQMMIIYMALLVLNQWIDRSGNILNGCRLKVMSRGD